MFYVENIENNKIIGGITQSKEMANLMGFKKSIEQIEQAYNGDWYVSGYAPEKPESVIKKERIEELKSLLASADYWGQKYIDGEYTAEEWEEKKAQRKAWREEIRSLENSVDSDG